MLVVQAQPGVMFTMILGLMPGMCHLQVLFPMAPSDTYYAYMQDGLVDSGVWDTDGVISGSISKTPAICHSTGGLS